LVKQYRLETDYNYLHPNRHYIYEHGEWGITLKITVQGDFALAQRIVEYLNEESLEKC
jgi:hypothetical protein